MEQYACRRSRRSLFELGGGLSWIREGHLPSPRTIGRRRFFGGRDEQFGIAAEHLDQSRFDCSLARRAGVSREVVHPSAAMRQSATDKKASVAVQRLALGAHESQ